MKKVAIILAKGFEEAEAIVPMDILRRAGITVDLLGLEEMVESARHVTIKADALLADKISNYYDAIFLPGGSVGAKNLSENLLVHELISKTIEKGSLVSAICASPAVVLASGGFLDKTTKYTGYPDSSLPYKSGGVYLSDRNMVLDDGFLTAKSMAYSLDFGLALVSFLDSPMKAFKIAKDICYEDWDLKYKSLYHSFFSSNQDLNTL